MTDELSLSIDHVTLSVAHIGRAAAFYEPVLGTIGLACVGAYTAAQTGSVATTGFGLGRKGSFWLAERGRQTPIAHVAFRASTRAAGRAFYDTALAAGGEDNGPPGIRARYHLEYYAAFVLDPEGHNIEAVTFAPEVAVC